MNFHELCEMCVIYTYICILTRKYDIDNEKDDTILLEKLLAAENEVTKYVIRQSAL